MKDIFGVKKPIIGMVHLLPTIGSPKFKNNIEDIISLAVNDALILEKCGVHGLLIENAGDIPTQIMSDIDYGAITTLTVVAKTLRKKTQIPIGLSVLTNGVVQALAIAKATGCKFIRSTSWVQGYYSAGGFVSPIAAKALRYKKFIDGDDIQIYADIKVKGGSHEIFRDKSFCVNSREAINNGANKVIITGAATGLPPNFDEIKKYPDEIINNLLIGSGVNDKNLKDALMCSNGLIVGSYFRKESRLDLPVDKNKASDFMEKYNKIRENFND